MTTDKIPQFISVLSQPGLEYFRMMKGQVVEDQLGLSFGRFDQAFAEIDQNIRVHAALEYLGAYLALVRDGRNHIGRRVRTIFHCL
jgi:hypothetical protein